MGGGAESPSQVRSAAGMLSGLSARLDELDADVLVDAGRLDTTAAVEASSDPIDR